MVSRTLVIALLLVLLLSIPRTPLWANEVTENTSHTPFSTLFSKFQEVKTEIEQNGTVRLTGSLADKFEREVLNAMIATRRESEEEEKKVQALLDPKRGPAILSADGILNGILSGELSKLEYPAFGIPKETTQWESVDDTKRGLGDEPKNGLNEPLDSVAALTKNIQDLNVGRLPIPYNGAPSLSDPSKKAREVLDRDNRASPYQEQPLGTSFGKNPSDEEFISKLVKPKKAAESQLKENLEKEQAEGDLVQDKEKEETEKKEREAKLKSEMSKIVELKSPYTMDNYYNVRDFFNKGVDGDSELFDSDLEFQEKAAEIFRFVPAGSTKSFADRDADRNKKKLYADFFTKFTDRVEAKSSLEPVKSNTHHRDKSTHEEVLRTNN